MALQEYQRKRNFDITSEPKGKVGKSKTKGLAFVIQKHDASHLHYDFRLELDGVLLSWAVPKGPSLNPNDKRLAMHVEDHPISYGDFEGIIPAKQYGGGTVLLWDRGTWIPREDPVAGYKKGKLKFDLHGEKLRGGWVLVKSHGGKYGGDKAWLLIKEDDEEARTGDQARVTDNHPNSVATKRTLDQIASTQDRVWNSNKSEKVNVKSGAVAARKVKKAVVPKKLEGAVEKPLPATVSAQLATLVKQAPAGDEWLYEIKFDGYRMLTRVDGKSVKIFSRNAKEWTSNFPVLQEAVGRLGLQSAWLDGEVVVLDEKGRSGFSELQQALSEHSQALYYYVFDLLYLNGTDLRGVPLVRRKALLEKLIPAKGPIRYSRHVEGNGGEFFQSACQMNLEGAIAKRADSLYRGDRSGSWVKVKCGARQEMVIGGFSAPSGSRSSFGALLVGVYDKGELKYSGRVGTGFDDKTLRSLRKVMDPLVQEKPAFINPPKGADARDVTWLRPTLVAEVAFTEWTPDGALRHPSYQGLRQDKKATDVVRERLVEKAPPPPAAPRAPKQVSKAAAREANSDGKVAGITISNPAKELYPEAKITKLELANYYRDVAAWILPELQNRPLSLVRCPNGWEKQTFYQKNADPSTPAVIDRVQVSTSDGPASYMAANSVEALVALSNLGVLEFHPWGSTTENLALPDRIILDFDPDEGMEWAPVVDAARVCRTLLNEIGLQCFLKTTGGKGLHVVVPLQPTVGWPTVKAFSKAVADLLVSAFPDRFTSKIAKASRRGKIFIDYLRNDEGSTAVGAYSTRARANAPVAMPIDWDDLKRKDLRFDHFNVRNVLGILKRRKSDPWAGISTTKQALTKEMQKRVGMSGTLPDARAVPKKSRWGKR